MIETTQSPYTVYCTDTHTALYALSAVSSGLYHIS